MSMPASVHALYISCVKSLMLYNCEMWAINNHIKGVKCAGGLHDKINV